MFIYIYNCLCLYSWTSVLLFSAVSWCLHSTKKPVTTMLTYPWKCTVLHCNHLGNTWKPLVLMTRHFDYCPSGSEGDNQSVRSSAPVVSRCFPGSYNVKLYISRGKLAWWLLFFLHSELLVRRLQNVGLVYQCFVNMDKYLQTSVAVGCNRTNKSSSCNWE